MMPLFCHLVAWVKEGYDLMLLAMWQRWCQEHERWSRDPDPHPLQNLGVWALHLAGQHSRAGSSTADAGEPVLRV